MNLKTLLTMGLSMLAVLATANVSAKDITLTRLLVPSVGAENQAHEERFTATPGSALLAIQNPATELQLTVILNDQAVAIPNGSKSVQVELTNDNVVSISTSGIGEGSIRITQTVDISLNVISRIHFNTNVSNFEEARAFYGMLGFDTASGFPDTNTVAMAQAIGIQTPTEYDGSQGGEAGGYLLHGELIGINGFGGGLIDLIEFTIPRDNSAPYAAINHLGMARAVMYTSDVDADFTYLKSQGVEFLAAPVTRTNSDRFAVFKDPDGTFYELVQRSDDTEEADEDQGTRIHALGPVGINVSDFQRSRAWYEMFGYNNTHALAPTESVEVAKAMGLNKNYEITGAQLTHEKDGSSLEIVQWLTPYNSEPPYPIPVNHLGIHRMAFLTTDIEADVATLKAQGVKFISDITPCCSGDDSWGSIVAFYDPDGTIVELAEQPFMGGIMRFMLWVGRLFD